MLTFQSEPFSEIKLELEPLLRAHWAEMPFDEDVPLAPSAEIYHRMEAHGNLHIETVRSDGKLAGYFVTFLGRHPHYDFLMGSMDVYYLAPELRKAATGIRLFIEMEKALRLRGVKYLIATARMDRDRNAGALFARLGWKPARVVFEKRLREDNGLH